MVLLSTLHDAIYSRRELLKGQFHGGRLSCATGCAIGNRRQHAIEPARAGSCHQTPSARGDVRGVDAPTGGLCFRRGRAA